MDQIWGYRWKPKDAKESLQLTEGRKGKGENIVVAFPESSSSLYFGCLAS